LALARLQTKEVITMEARSELHVRRWHHWQAPVSELKPLVPTRKVTIALTCGIVGGLVMALPILLYDWVKAAHSALELPMAATAWLFGLDHFAQNGYHWWPIAIGALFLLGYWVLHGAVFGAVADRFLKLRTLPETLGAGLAWGFVGWLFFWYTLLPIARDGAPFRATAASSLLVAPNWIYIVAFAALGVATSLAYWVLRRA
jgi:hypothetical protein